MAAPVVLDACGRWPVADIVGPAIVGLDVAGREVAGRDVAGRDVAGLGAVGLRPSSAGYPRPAAYRPASAALKEGKSPFLGWLVNRVRTSSCSEPSTSSAKPCSARFGPTSTKTRAPASYRVCRPLTNWTGEATWRPSASSIRPAASGPSVR